MLLIDLPGLCQRDVLTLSAALPNLQALAGQYAAVLVPIACGSLAARRATLATGVLPTLHGVIHDKATTLQTKPFWARAAALQPGRRTAYAGSCTPLGESASLFHRFENGRPAWIPDPLRHTLCKGLPAPLRDCGVADTAWAFAFQALQTGASLVWLECNALGHAEPGQREATLAQLDAAVGCLLQAASDRVVMVLAATATATAEAMYPPAPGARFLFQCDHRLMHVYCGPQAATQFAGELRTQPAFARVVAGAQRHELGVACPDAGDVIAELRPGWAFAPGQGQPAWAHAGQDSAPQDMPVLLARGLNLPKSIVGMCEVAWIAQHVLTGQEFHDEG